MNRNTNNIMRMRLCDYFRKEKRCNCNTINVHCVKVDRLLEIFNHANRAKGRKNVVEIQRV